MLPQTRGIGTRASPEQAGAYIAEGLQKFGAGATKMGEFYGQVAADDATNKAQREKDNLLYGEPGKMVQGPDGDPVPDRGFFGLSGADALNALPNVRQRLDEIDANAREQLSTPESRLQFEQETRRYRFYSDREIGQHADSQYKTYQINTNETSAKLALNKSGADPLNPSTAAEALDQTAKAYIRIAQTKGDSDAAGAKLRAEQDVTMTRIHALIGQNKYKEARDLYQNNAGILASLPNYDATGNVLNSGTADAMIGEQSKPGAQIVPSGGFDNAWNFTHAHEGGYAAKDANGAPVNMGVNQAAHPEVDVRHLTPEQAKSIGQKYWNESGAGQLPAGLDTAYFDTYWINPAAARRMLAQSNGDPQKFMDLREGWMRGMIAKEPDKFGRFQKAWDTRNKDLHAQIGGAQIPGSSEHMAAVRAQAEAAFPDNPYMVEKVVRGVEENVKRDNAERDTGFENNVKDGIAFVGDGGDPNKVPFTVQDIATKIPGPRGQALAQEYQASLEYNSAVKQIATAPQDRVEQIVDGKTPEGYENYRENEGMHAALAKAAQARMKAIYGDDKHAGDPAGYVHAQFPDVAAAFDHALKNPKDSGGFDNYVKRLNATYETLGVPENRRATLPRRDAQQFIAALQNKDPATAWNNLKGLEAETGKWWGAVYRDLGRNGLPSTFQALMVAGDNRQNQQTMLAAINADSTARAKGKPVMADVLKDAVTKDNKSVIETINRTIAKDAGLASLRRSMIGVAGPGAIAQYDGIENTIRQTAQYLYLQNGTLGADAAAAAAAKMVTGTFDFVPQGEHAPVRLKAGDTADFQSASHFVLNRIKDGDVRPYGQETDRHGQPLNMPGQPTFDTSHAQGMKAPGNLDPWDRPVLHNPDGSYSTTSSISVGTDHGETLIPTVINGKRYSNADAIAHFKKTGENFGTFDTAAHADAFATSLHNAQAARYDAHGNPLANQLAEHAMDGARGAYWYTGTAADGSGYVRAIDPYTDRPVIMANGKPLDIPFAKFRYYADQQQRAMTEKRRQELLPASEQAKLQGAAL